MKINIFDKLSFVSLSLVIILLPFFFLPFTTIPIETSKGVLLVLGLAFSIVFWGFARLFDGKITIPRSICLLAGGGVVLAFLLSSIFSTSSQVSFFGTMFDPGSFWFIFSGFLLMLISSIVFRDLKKARMLLFGAILSSAIVLIFQIAHLFAPGALSLGVLAEKTSNLLGSWNALGIFAGFSVLMLLLVVEFFSTSKIEKLIFQILIILGMVVVAAVNFLLVWEFLGIFTLIIFVYKISISSSKNQSAEKNIYFPFSSFAVIMVALLFFISGSFVGGILPNKLGLQNNEISPSFTTTMGITKSVIKNDPIFGIGPNRFEEAWAKYKPASINTSDFWDISFSSGSGMLPTFAATTGLVGIVSLIIFLVFFVVSGMKSIFSSVKNQTNWETTAFFVLSFYLFVSCFFYNAGSVMFLLALAFTGAFIGLSLGGGSKEEIVWSFLDDHRKSFFSMLVIILLVVTVIAISFKYVERVVSVSYFGKALSASTIESSETSIARALSLHKNDLYFRAYAQIYLLKLDSLIKKGDKLSEAEKPLVQASLDQAVNGAQAAIAYNPRNYLNFRALGALYQNLALLGVKDGNSKAVEAYQSASDLNVLSPGLKLDMANVSFLDGKNKEAKDYANTALELKPNYVDALILLSQIAKKEGDNTLARSYAEKALAILPTNADLIKYVESFKNSSSSDVVPPSDVTPSSSGSPVKNNPKN